MHVIYTLQYFVTSYDTDPYIRWLLDNTRIHILPVSIRQSEITVS